MTKQRNLSSEDVIGDKKKCARDTRNFLIMQEGASLNLHIQTEKAQFNKA